MEFDQAAKRLEQEHRRLRAQEQEKRSFRTHLASPTAVAKAQQMEEYRRKQVQIKREKELRENKQRQLLTDYMNSIEHNRLGYNSFSPPSSAIHLKATSIHGQGDKVTLPPSILSLLAQHDLLVNPKGMGQPLFFRLAIEREGYSFPTSLQLRKLASDPLSMADSQHETTDENIMEDEDEHDFIEISVEPYLYELAHKFVSYTFATVIEFTEEEGCIGLPYDISMALLDSNKCDSKRRSELLVEGDSQLGSKGQDAHSTIIEKTTTVDVSESTLDITNNKDLRQEIMETDSSYSFEHETPGHPAYGKFPVPLKPIQLSLLTNVPLGTRCSLKPTQAAIEHGFHRLKDIKYVLEQSLVKTRASLSIGDTVHAWFRGVRYDLTVQAVEPSDFGVVSCVNTDITVDIVSDDDDKEDRTEVLSSSAASTLGYRLGSQTHHLPSDRVEPTYDERESTSTNSREHSNFTANLPLEPCDGENIVTIQIRGGDVVSKRRRFDASSTRVRSLFDYARIENIIQGDSTQYRLVTRFPRIVFDYVDDGEKTLLEVGMGQQTQIMLLLERKNDS